MIFVKRNRAFNREVFYLGKHGQAGLLKDVTATSPKMVENTRDPRLSELVCAHIKFPFRTGSEDALKTAMPSKRTPRAGQQSQVC